MMHVACCLLRFVSPSLQCCYKRKHQTSLMHLERWLLCFVSPSLQYCDKMKHVIARMHIACCCLLCFVSPSLQYYAPQTKMLEGGYKRWNMRLRGTFLWCEYLIWATNHWNVNQKSTFHLLFIVPKSSFGEHKYCYKRKHQTSMMHVACCSLLVVFCKPIIAILLQKKTSDERRHEHDTSHVFCSVVVFCKPIIAILWRCSLKCLFILPKFSFGTDKVEMS